MRVFVTGATGFIGSALVPELLDAGHQVVGLARSDAAADALRAVGAEPYRGTLDDPETLRAAAAAADGVAHLAYDHDFSRIAAAAQTDRGAVDVIGEALAGTDRPFVIASGLLGLQTGGGLATERDGAAPDAYARIANATATLALAERGVRSAVVRLAPTVHGAGDHGFVPALIGIARQTGVSAYIDAGEHRWAAVHRLDAATLFRLALERGAAGSVFHGVAEEGVTTRGIAEAIGQHLGLPVRSIARAEAAAHFGWMAYFFGADMAASSAITREQLRWTPTHPGLIDDLAAGHYFAPSTA